MDNAIHCINLYPVYSAVHFVKNYPMDSNLPVGYRYPPVGVQVKILH